MTQKNQVYKCEICGNIIEILHESYGQIICCKKPMTLLIENKVDAPKEKHIPVLEAKGTKLIVRVGSINHPMTNDHYIEFIEIFADGKIYRQQLQPNQEPKAEFCINSDKVEARAYCNLHGLWKSS